MMQAPTEQLTGEREAGSTHDPGESSIRSGASHLRFWLVAAGILWLDLWSKQWVFRELGSTETRPFLRGTIDFRRSLNDGAVFGSFTGYTGLFIGASVFALGVVLYLFAHSTRLQRSLHVALAMILAGALGNLYDRAFAQADVVRYQTPSGRTASLIGKVVDPSGDEFIHVGDWPDGAHARRFERSKISLRRQGVVRDFIKFVPKFPSWVPRLGGTDLWPWVFNIADAALVCGVGVLLLHIWLDRRPREQQC